MANTYPASDIRAMFTLASRRPGVLSLTVGEPDFPTPEHIKEAAIAAIRNDETRYVANAGMPELRDAVAATYGRRWGRPLDADNVMVAVGGMEALALAMEVTVRPGDEVLITDPGYPNYRGLIHRIGARAVTVPVRESEAFKLRAADVAAAITERTAAIILNSPSNPLGSMIDGAELAAICELADRHQVTVVSDEVYDEIVFDEAKHVSVAEVDPSFDRFLVITSMSKTYAMTGWRCGFVIGAADLVAPMPLLQEGLTACVPAFVQRAAIAALTGPSDPTRAMVASYQQRRDLIVDRLNAIDGIHTLTPEATFYAWANVSSLGPPSWDLAVDLLEQQNLAVVPGSAFGPRGEGYLRLTFAAHADSIMAACERLAAYVAAR